MPATHDFDIEHTPFSQVPDESTFYSSSALQQRLNMLSLLLGGKDKLVLMLGDSGSGKTLLLKQFLGTNPKAWSPCRINAGISEDGKKNAGVKNLSDYKAYICNKTEFPVIIIDSAEKLSEEDILFLFRLTGVPGYTKKLQQVILFGRPALKKKLSLILQDKSNQDSCNKIYMPALSSEETEAFIKKQLFHTPFKDKALFSAKELEKIYKASGGLPGRIITEANNLLFFNILSQKHSKKDHKKKIIIISAILLILMTVIFFMMMPEDKPNISNNGLPPSADITGKKTTKADPGRPEQSLSKTDNPLEQKNDTEFEKEPPQDSVKEIEKSDSPSNELKNEPKNDSGLNTIKTEEWIMQQSPDSYTIQIIGTSNEDKMRAFIIDSGIDEDAAYFHTFKNNKDWFSFISGVYDTSKEASSARSLLPEKIKVYNPWVRKFNSVHRDIANGRYSADKNGEQ